MVASDGVRGAGVDRDAGWSEVPAGTGRDTPTARSCARPVCPAPAAAILRFAYTTREVVIEPLCEDPPPQTYDLCGAHATRTRPPHGWTLRDVRPDEAPAVDAGVSGALGGRDTVALLAAALDAAADMGVGGSVDSSPPGVT